MKWFLKITKTDNGFVLQGTDDYISVIEEDEKDELKEGQRLLWAIMTYFNFGGSKHDKERLRVVREKQGKFF